MSVKTNMLNEIKESFKDMWEDYKDEFTMKKVFNIAKQYEINIIEGCMEDCCDDEEVMKLQKMSIKALKKITFDEFKKHIE